MTKGIAIICPNPAIDRILRVPRFEAGKVFRAQAVHALAGGKGVNVARILVELGYRPAILGFAGGAAGQQLADGVRALGAEARFVPISGETRTCCVIVDDQAGKQTVINEPGPAVTPAEVEALWQAFEDEVGRSEWVLLSGSLPVGVPMDLYARMIRLCREKGVKTVLDASGEPLRAAAAAGPSILKVNKEEYAQVLGDLSKDAGAGAAPPAVPAGSTALPPLLGGSVAHIVTDGAARTTVLEPGARWYVEPPRVDAVNAVGAGDSFLAGLVAELAAGSSLRQAVRFATACACVKVQHLLPTLGDAARARALAGQITVVECCARE